MGASESFIFTGDRAVGVYTVMVNFSTMRTPERRNMDPNLYVNGVRYDGTAIFQARPPPGGLRLFTVTDFGSTGVIGSGPDTLAPSMSEDPYKGDAEFTVAVDGIELAGTFTAMARHSAGASQTSYSGDWGIFGNHTVILQFLNDLRVRRAGI